MRMKKRILSLILVIGILSSLAYIPIAAMEYTHQSTEYKLYVDGRQIYTDVNLYEINGVYFAPVRAFAEGFEACVSWDASTQTVIITKDENEMLVPLNSNQWFFNGKPVIVAVPVQTIEGRTMLPIKDIAKCFGCRYSVDENELIIKVDSEQFFIYSIDKYERFFINEIVSMKLGYENKSYSSVIVYVGFYNASGKLVHLEKHKCSLFTGSGELYLTLSKRYFSDIISTVKIFSWNDAFCPLSYKITVDEEGYVFF